METAQVPYFKPEINSERGTNFKITINLLQKYSADDEMSYNSSHD